MFKRLCAILLIVSVLVTSTIPSAALAQMSSLPVPGSMLGKTPDFSPLIMQGVRVHPDNALLFDFIIDSGDSGLATDSAAFRQEAGKLVNYFLASLTIKEEDLWVNLSPFEHNRILSPDLEKTELGSDLLAQDYILKQLSASLIYPEENLGETFWNRVYARAREEFGTTNIPVDTFHKIWIKADKVRVIEHEGAAYVAGAHLKVMLEQDYLAISRTPSDGEGSDIARDILREVIVPEIEKEVNRGTHFAPLRQMFNSMILATWYKLALKDALLNRIYSDRGKTGGVLADDPAEAEKIYERYLEAYKKGVFNYIKETPGANEEPTLPRKYFSGGVDGNLAKILERVDAAAAPTELTAPGNSRRSAVTVRLETVAQPVEDSVPAKETQQRIENFLAGHSETATDASMLSDLNELIKTIRELPVDMFEKRFEELSLLTSKKQLRVLRDLFDKIRGLDEPGVEHLISRIKALGLRQAEMDELVENLEKTVWMRKEASGPAVSTDRYITLLKKKIALSLSFIVLGFISGSFAVIDMLDNRTEWTSLLAIFASYIFFILARHLDKYIKSMNEQPAKRTLGQNDLVNLAEQFLVLYQNGEAIPGATEELARDAVNYEIYFWLLHERYIAPDDLPAAVRGVSQQLSLTPLKGPGSYWSITVNHPDPLDSNTDQSQAAKGGIDLNAKTMSLDISRTAASAAIRMDQSAFDGFEDNLFSGLQGIIIRIVPVENPAVFLGV